MPGRSQHPVAKRRTCWGGPIAYGGVAMFCAYVFWQLRDQWHLSQWLVIPILLVVVAPILGLILEAVFRPLATASAEVQIVVALGMLAFFIILVPIIFGGADHQLTLRKVIILRAGEG